MPRPSPRCGKPSRKLLRRTVELGHPAHTKSRKLTGHCVDSHRVRCWVQIVWIGERCPSSLRKNDVSTSERRWSGCVAQQRNIFAGCSKRPSSKAAASEEARRTLRYVEPLSEARTPLADFFSILLEESGDVHPASNRFHLIRHHLTSLPEGIVRRGHDQILHHLHVATFHHFGIDDDADKLHSPGGSDRHTATAGRPGHGLRRGLFLYLRHLRLHRLRLLQNISHIAERVLHSSTSFCLDNGLTSASSVPNISSACLTTGCARACSKRTSRCSFSFAVLSCAIVGPGGSDSVNSTIRSRTVCPLSRSHIAVSAAILSGFSIIARATVACLANPIVTTWPSTPTNRPISKKGAILGNVPATSS